MEPMDSEISQWNVPCMRKGLDSSNRYYAVTHKTSGERHVVMSLVNARRIQEQLALGRSVQVRDNHVPYALIGNEWTSLQQVCAGGKGVKKWGEGRGTCDKAFRRRAAPEKLFLVPCCIAWRPRGMCAWKENGRGGLIKRMRPLPFSPTEAEAAGIQQRELLPALWARPYRTPAVVHRPRARQGLGRPRG